jgi:hypothetical protein
MNPLDLRDGEHTWITVNRLAFRVLAIAAGVFGKSVQVAAVVDFSTVSHIMFSVSRHCHVP